MFLPSKLNIIRASRKSHFKIKINPPKNVKRPKNLNSKENSHLPRTKELENNENSKKNFRFTHALFLYGHS